MRNCIKCHESKDESAFYHPLFHVDNICKECHSEKARKDYADKRARQEATRLAQIEKYVREVMG